MSLTKREIAIKVVEKLGITQQEALAAVQCTLDSIKEELLAGGNVELRNFGVFEILQMRQRVGRNPNKPEKSITIPARKVIKFRAGRELKEKLN